MKLKFTFINLYLFTLSVSSFGQISEGGIPFGITNNLLSQVSFNNMPSFNLQQMQSEDVINDPQKGLFRFGFNHDVNITQQNSGINLVLPDGGKLWLLGIHSAGALSINLAFRNFNLPAGAKMFVYNPDGSQIFGAFTSANNQQDGEFATDLLMGESLIIEYYEPQEVFGTGTFELFRVTHAYRGVNDYLSRAFGDAGSCQINVVCPSGAPWTDEIKSVCMLVSGGNGFCSAALMNNVLQDGTPYVLTANHCGSSGFGTWVFRFNWQSATCTNPGSSPSSNSLTGAVQVAANAGSDFSLVRINSTPPANYNVFYAGWSNVNIPAISATGIHHPSADIKKISFAPNATISSTYSGAACWRVGTWTMGCTEGGSSGSPLFDQNHRVIGQLFGGPSACGQSAPNMNDYYGKFSTSWNTGTSAATRLRDWLDPGNTSVTTLDGYDPNNITVALDANVLSIVSPVTGSYCLSSITPSFVLRNRGLNTLTSVTVNYKLDNNPANIYSWTGSLATNATATVTLPVISVAAGAHTYSVYTSQPNGSSDMNTTNDSTGVSFTIVSPTPLVNLPVNEGFEAATFPPTNWTRINSDNSTTWQRYPAFGGFGGSTACIKIDNFNYSSGNGQSDIMQTPYLNFSSAASPLRIYFDVAFAYYGSSNPDSLFVSYSTNCGLTWTRIYAKGRALLATNGGGQTTTAFVPTATQWRKDSININSLAGLSAVLFAFENKSAYGNNMYLDNINIMQGILTGISEPASDHSDIAVYPNPSDGNVNIQLDNSYSGDVNVALYNSLGEKMYSEFFHGGTTKIISKDFSSFSKGIYFLRVVQGGNVTNKKIVLTGN